MFKEEKRFIIRTWCLFEPDVLKIMLIFEEYFESINARGYVDKFFKNDRMELYLAFKMSEVEKGKFFIVLALLTTVILSLVGPIWQMLISAFPNWIVNSLGVSLCSMGMATAPFLVMLLAAPIFYWKKWDITLLGYLYIASVIPAHMINYPWALGHRYLFASRYMEQELADEIVPWFISPPADVCRVMSVGGP